MTPTKAVESRQNAALNKQYRFAHGVDTFRAMIDRGVFSYAEAVTVPRIYYNRIKFNRMDGRQQAEYEKRLKETKTEYRLIYKADSELSVNVPKLVFDYFQGLNA